MLYYHNIDTLRQSQKMKSNQLLLLFSFIPAACSISLIALKGSQFVFILSGLFALSAVLIWILYFPDILLMVLISLCFDVFGLVPVLQELRLPWAYGATPPDLILILVLFWVITLEISFLLEQSIQDRLKLAVVFIF